jgi:hypothetical protein
MKREQCQVYVRNPNEGGAVADFRDRVDVLLAQDWLVFPSTIRFSANYCYALLFRDVPEPPVEDRKQFRRRTRTGSPDDDNEIPG